MIDSQILQLLLQIESALGVSINWLIDTGTIDPKSAGAIMGQLAKELRAASTVKEMEASFVSASILGHLGEQLDAMHKAIRSH